MNSVTRRRWPELTCAVAALVAALLAMDVLRLFGGVPVLDFVVGVETHYYYALLFLLLPFAFLLWPLTERGWGRWLDTALAALTAVCCAWLYATSIDVLDNGWEFGAPFELTVVAIALWVLVLEGLRRVAGLSLFLIAGLFSLYPVVADSIPDPFSGLPASFAETMAYHSLGTESLLGIPFRAFANLVFGFLVFGVVLQKTGGGQFFIELAFALLGRSRGGAAKVAVIASGLMGSMSGSVVTNVVTTGQLTIPAMKRAGLVGEDAAGVEACASTGGVLLPPVMGSTAFVMAAMLGQPYYQVAIAATIPALLYFVGLYMQVDLLAGRLALVSGESEQGERRTALQVLVQGWHYLAVFALLVVLLVGLQREAHAPWIASGVLLVLHQLVGERWGWHETLEFLVGAGRLLVEILVILTGVGLIVGALSLTGLSGTLVNELLHLSGGSTIGLLMIGAATSFVLGIGMTVTAAYVFLAVVLAPALVTAGLPALGVHLFILYWAMLSFITPPVALGAYAAASVAGANPLRSGLAAMRMGSIIYFIPFFFVWNRAFLMAGEWWQSLLATSVCVGGIYLIAVGLQGWAPRHGVLSAAVRLGAIFAGAALAALAANGSYGAGVAFAVVPFAWLLWRRKQGVR